MFNPVMLELLTALPLHNTPIDMQSSIFSSLFVS